MAEMNKRKVDFTDVVFYLAIASKHARLMVLLVVLALVAGLTYYVFKRPVYRSISTVRYVDLAPVGDDAASMEKRRFSERQVLEELTAPHITRRAQKRLGFEQSQQDPRKPLFKNASAWFNSEGNIELDCYVYEASWAERFPEFLVEELMKARTERNTEALARIQKSGKREIEQLKERIAVEAAKKAALDREYDPERLKLVVEQLSQISKELVEVQSRLTEYEKVRARINSSETLSTIERLMIYSNVETDLQVGDLIPSAPASDFEAPRTSGKRRGRQGGFQPLDSSQTQKSRIVTPDIAEAQSRNWVELDRERSQLRLQLQEASRRYLDRHPVIRELRDKLAGVEKSLSEALYNAHHAFELSYDKLKAREHQLKLREPEYQAALKRLNEYLGHLRSHSQESYWEEQWRRVHEKMERAGKAYEYDRVELSFLNIKLLRDRIPVSPPRFKLVLFSFVMGIALAIGIPFLLEFLDQTVTNMDKLEADTHMKGLGLVPDFEDTIAEAYPLIGSESMTDPDMLENFRVIRTNLVAAAATSKYPQVVMVTSTGPKEGKTVVSSNLALSFAQMGDKTLYIDTNLRRGLVHHLFSVRSSPGLSNALVEKLDVNEAIRETAVENLSVLPTGDHLDGDIEMLGSTRLQQIMDELRDKYQRIILDAPPILGLSETAVVQPVVDGVVMVIWSAFTSTRQIRTAMDILGDNHANFYGFVLNRLDLSATMNRFHYYYYSNHYYNRYQSMTVG